jgi:curved DNA-binding protein CbpA
MSFVAPILEESPEYLERFRNSLKESPVDGAQSDKKEMTKDISSQIAGDNATEEQEKQHETRISDQEEGEKCGIKEQGIEAKVCSIGPELPTADQFQQAAEIMKTIAYTERKDGTDEDAFFIGPVPPEFEQEDLEGALHFSILGVTSSCMFTILGIQGTFIIKFSCIIYLVVMYAASTDERLAEVGRIVSVLQEFEQRKAKAKSGSPLVLPNPYKVLGIDQESSATEIKKHYWKLSLLIHPDKCSHASAGVAFKALSSAASQLQDSSKRKEIDEQIERDQDMEIAREIAKEQERAMAWSVAKGEAPKPMAKMNIVAEREAWMTELPQKRKGASMPSVSTKCFSAARKTEQDSTWASIPGKADVGPQMLPKNPEVSEKVSQDSAAFPTSEKKSLLEKHLAGMGSKSKASGVKRDSGVSPMSYRPFDREKDLEIKPKTAQDPKAMLKHLKGLGSRFGSGSNH